MSCFLNLVAIASLQFAAGSLNDQTLLIQVRPPPRVGRPARAPADPLTLPEAYLNLWDAQDEEEKFPCSSTQTWREWATDLGLGDKKCEPQEHCGWCKVSHRGNGPSECSNKAVCEALENFRESWNQMCVLECPRLNQVVLVGNDRKPYPEDFDVWWTRCGPPRGAGSKCNMKDQEIRLALPAPAKMAAAEMTTANDGLQTPEMTAADPAPAKMAQSAAAWEAAEATSPQAAQPAQAAQQPTPFGQTDQTAM